MNPDKSQPASSIRDGSPREVAECLKAHAERGFARVSGIDLPPPPGTPLLSSAEIEALLNRMGEQVFPPCQDLTAAELAKIERAYQRHEAARQLVIFAIGVLAGAALTVLVIGTWMITATVPGTPP